MRSECYMYLEGYGSRDLRGLSELLICWACRDKLDEYGFYEDPSCGEEGLRGPLGQAEDALLTCACACTTRCAAMTFSRAASRRATARATSGREKSWQAFYWLFFQKLSAKPRIVGDGCRMRVARFPFVESSTRIFDELCAVNPSALACSNRPPCSAVRRANVSTVAGARDGRLQA